MHAYAHTFIHTQKCATFSMDQQRRRRKPSSTEGRGKLPAWVSLRKAQKQAKSRATAFLSPSLKHPNMANLPCPLSHDRETTVAREFFSFRVSPGFVLHSEQNIQTKKCLWWRHCCDLSVVSVLKRVLEKFKGLRDSRSRKAKTYPRAGCGLRGEQTHASQVTADMRASERT